jgi:hypothetical protein
MSIKTNKNKIQYNIAPQIACWQVGMIIRASASGFTSFKDVEKQSTRNENYCPFPDVGVNILSSNVPIDETFCIKSLCRAGLKKNGVISDFHCGS